MKTEELLQSLQNPENMYRGKPFWAWNGELEEKELLRQIDCMHEMGFGGFFIHSRTGLITEYLGDEWFRLVRVCAEYAHKKYGMETWLYDEDRWPSGTCGGMVARERKNRLRFLSLYKSDEDALACKEVVDIVCRYAVKLMCGEDGEERLIDCYPVQSAREVREEYEYAVFAEEEQQCSDFYNGFAYIDTMNRDVTAVFLQSTHEKYYKTCGDLFGTAIKGIFTDEPYRGSVFTGFGISNENKRNMTPYTGELFNAYASKYGHELCVPEIYWRRVGEKHNATATRYIDVLDDLFTQNFAKPCRDWCAAHGLILTGHILHEDSLSIQASLTGSCMRYYEYMDYPGIDVLTEENNVYWAAVQCASVARQLGKKFVLSELYGATGWNMTLDRYKTCADWQAFFGINFRCQHLSWYTMQGEAKRDYPASILHQNAWYKDWKAVEDYFSRLALLSAEGDKLCDTLVVAPMREAWGNVHLGWMDGLYTKDENAVRLDTEYVDDFRSLLFRGVDFDYGDEEILRKYGSVEKENGNVYLRVGKVRYAQVYYNPSYAIDSTAKKLLNEFATAGGFIARKADDLTPTWEIYGTTQVAAVGYAIEKDVWLHILNFDKKNRADGELVLPERLQGLCAELWDFRTGECKGIVAIEEKDGKSVLPLTLSKGQEYIVRFTETPQITESVGAENYAPSDLPEKFAYELTEPNVLPLDEAVWEEDGKPKNDGNPRNVLHIDREIRQKHKKRLRGGEMLQPWFVRKYGYSAKPQKLCNLRLCYSFFVQDSPQSAVLAMEKTRLSCFVNGAPLGKASDKFWVDKCFTLYPIELQAGENRIELCGEFEESDGLEAMYILGDFGVSLPKTITSLPSSLTAGDISAQGLPYYTGSILYHTGIESGNISINLPAAQGAAVRLYGGKETKTLAFAPYTANVELNSELIIELVFNRRNTFGPLHQTMPQSVCAPDSFLTDGKDYVLFAPIAQGLKIKGDKGNENG